MRNYFSLIALAVVLAPVASASQQLAEDSPTMTNSDASSPIKLKDPFIRLAAEYQPEASAFAARSRKLVNSEEAAVLLSRRIVEEREVLTGWAYLTAEPNQESVCVYLNGQKGVVDQMLTPEGRDQFVSWCPDKESIPGVGDAAYIVKDTVKDGRFATLLIIKGGRYAQVIVPLRGAESRNTLATLRGLAPTIAGRF